MIDVLIIGASDVGRSIAIECLRSNLLVTIIDDSSEKPADWAGEWLSGRGVLSGKGRVAILDPATGDEKRIVEATAIVLAVGRLDSSKPTTRMLGATKIGAVLSNDGQTIITDHRGRTRADGLYAVGGCASSETPGVIEDIMRYCTSRLTNEQQ